MFELMDTDQAALAEAQADRREIELLWKQEKDNLRVAQRVSTSGGGAIIL